MDSAFARPAVLPANPARLSSRRAAVALFIAVAIPIPALTASGLSVPLPGFVARAAFALVPGNIDERRSTSTAFRSHPTIAITQTATELERAGVAPTFVHGYRGTTRLVASGHTALRPGYSGQQVARHEVHTAGPRVSQAGASPAWLPPPPRTSRDPDTVLAPPAAPGDGVTAAKDKSDNPAPPGQTDTNPTSNAGSDPAPPAQTDTNPTSNAGGNPAPPGQTPPPTGGNPAPPGQTTPPGQAKKS